MKHKKTQQYTRKVGDEFREGPALNKSQLRTPEQIIHFQNLVAAGMAARQALKAATS